ncbi:MAG: type II toxin-antitoxin system RelE/ParE family toxin [Nanoarchaeota archaeon]|nr:type II toxin-antitoxin system RelE/ParE family toxin [Nanoarchaeota archaeon]
MFELEYSNSSKKFIKNIEKELLLRIFNRLEMLKENPVPSDAKFIGRENNEKVFRIRIGKHRVLYKIKETEKIILISKIDKRERVYD